MFQAPRMVSLHVPNVAQAQQWYEQLLGRKPVFEAPFAAIFALGECALALVPGEGGSAPESRTVAFLGVDDIEAAYERLLAAGASRRAEISLSLPLRARMAQVVDPFGNVIGIMGGAEPRRSVEQRPSESAMTVAFSRALAAHDDREGLRGPDHLAEIFLTDEGRQPLGDRTGREWLIDKMAGTHGYFLARTRYLDALVERALRAAVPQLVFLGAGYDSRPYRFAHLIRDTRLFEVDIARTQERKRRLLAQAGVAVPAQLAYVPINFERESLAEVLGHAGFDRTAATCFVWEGVSYYLTAPAVDSTLEFVRQSGPPGSSVCFDYLLQAPDLANRPGVKEVLEAWRSAYSGEPVQFGIEEGSIETFVSSRGFRLLEHVDAAALEQRFLALPDGSLVARVVGLFGLVHAAVAVQP